MTTHLGVPQELHDPTLVRREADDLPNDRAHELCLLGLDALALRGLHRFRDGSRGVAVVQAQTRVYSLHSAFNSVTMHDYAPLRAICAFLEGS